MKWTSLIAPVLLVVACGGGHGDPADAPSPDAFPAAPVFRNAVDMADGPLATAALRILGADVPSPDDRCQGCHGLTRQHLRYWGGLTDAASAQCLTDLAVTSSASALAMIDCLRTVPGDEASAFSTAKLGVWSSAVDLPWFRFLFAAGYGAAEGPARYDAFAAQVAEPRGGGTALTQGQLDVVGEWFARGLPALDSTLPEDPAPTECLPEISGAVATHVTAMATQGWRALDSGLSMYGCAQGDTALQCLKDQPRASTLSYATGWEVAPSHLRVLRAVNYQSAYWTRSSADGRFVAHGGQSGGSNMIDLTDDHIITVDDAYYDPAFFPDNSGFVFQGQSNNLCPQSVLLGGITSLTMGTAPGCSQIDQVGLYEHVGRALGGGDYFSVSGDFVSDDGGHFVTLSDPDAFFGHNGYVTLTPMTFDGTSYVVRDATDVATPWEGDTVLSPSSRLMISRVSGPSSQQLGYVMRAVNATPSGNGYAIEAPEVARYCTAGAKPAFSYDERWLIYHHYVTDADAVELGFTGSGDPSFAAYKSFGAANVYLLDLLTGATTRITMMAPRQYALYPHFRADGWIYFIVRDHNRGQEYVVASDAALRMEAP